jgi:hypothetical protein
MAFSWGRLLKSVALGIAKAVSLGLIGRGRKTQQAGEIVEDVIEGATKKDEPTKTGY